MAQCVIRIPQGTSPTAIQAAINAAKASLTRPRPHLVTLHETPSGDTRITCTCRCLPRLVEDADAETIDLVLSLHLADDPRADHLVIDDTARGTVYGFTPDAAPELSLALTGGER